jgi:phosphoglycolate phosphatase-like HAD superfamily hydrolase
VIINIRGTSGSGKTHLVRQIMAEYPTKLRHKVEGRKQPIGYVMAHPERRSLAIIGHYETACGGCDTIAKMETIFELVKESASRGMDVIFEGLLISADVNRHVDLHQWAQENGQELEVVALTTELQECLDSVNARRKARNPDLPPVKEKNTISKFNGVKKSLERLRAAEVPVFEGSREEALAHIRGKLGL